MAAVLELRDVVSGYHKKQVLHGVNLHVNEGEIVAMTARSDAPALAAAARGLGGRGPAAHGEQRTRRESDNQPEHRQVIGSYPGADQRADKDPCEGMRIRLIERDIVCRWRGRAASSHPEAVFDAGKTLDVGRETRAFVGKVSGSMVSVRGAIVGQIQDAPAAAAQVRFGGMGYITVEEQYVAG